MQIIGNGNNVGQNFKVVSEASLAKTDHAAERVSSRDNSVEGKASKAMMKALNVLDFSHADFLYPIATAPLAIRRRFVESVYILFQMWSRKYDNALWKDNDELDFLVSVKRVAESLEPYMDI